MLDIRVLFCETLRQTLRALAMGQSVVAKHWSDAAYVRVTRTQYHITCTVAVRGADVRAYLERACHNPLVLAGGASLNLAYCLSERKEGCEIFRVIFDASSSGMLNAIAFTMYVVSHRVTGERLTVPA